MTVQLLPEVTLTGPQRVEVGGTLYGVPATAGVRYAQEGRIAYVLDRARVHVLVRSGEVQVPNDLRHRIGRTYFGAPQR